MHVSTPIGESARDHVIARLALLPEWLPYLFTLLIKKWTENWLENSLSLEIK